MTAVTEPTEIQAGDLLEWTKSLPGYPASEWTLRYTFINATSKITINASADGDDHVVSEAAADTAGYASGYYSWAGRVTNISDPLQKFTPLSGDVRVLPDLESRTTYDGRSYARRTLDAIQAVIEKRASKDQLAYTIADRQLSKMTPEQLFMFRDRFLADVANEEAKESGVNGHVVQQVF